MEQILRGDLPPGAKADLKTLASLAGVTRTGFYPKKNRDVTTRAGAYQHLAEEFSRRLEELQDAGEIVDPRAAQIERLKKNAELRGRISHRDAEVARLTEFKVMAISRLAAQHEEIKRLRSFTRALIRTTLSRLCRPGDTFYFSNIATPNPYAALMTRIGRWNLVERTPADIEADIRAAAPPGRNRRRTGHHCRCHWPGAVCDGAARGQAGVIPAVGLVFVADAASIVSRCLR
ncbi:hypothetical protein [Streptomyces violaceus]|uniref:Uncharacterized protein n=1 Tax=Streptomyces violaceus TaxID=1936 RepID=A0ABY9U0R1_STRVL|nr:hypothetical protein [Streptomyces janthinus]WND15920.1 hypothetical protein RI060_00400 [Streptomyces janthinus]